MEKIYKSEISDSFIIGNEYYPFYQYDVYNEDNNVFIRHVEVINKYACYGLPYSEIVDRDGNGFADVQSCIDYLKEVAQSVNGIDSAQAAIRLESKKYKKRIADGVKMSRDLMSELRVNSSFNNLPRSVNKEIETKLEKVKTNIDRGWWVTAKEELDLVIPSGYLTQELWDRINLTITNYINDNY